MKKVTILSLHLGYGGIENAICSLANMLSKKYEVEIISTYKLYSEPAFYLDEKVKVTYLIEDVKPNRKEIHFYKNNKNYSMLFKEAFKSIKVLFLKRTRMIKTIRNLDTDVVITTRTLHNNWVSKFGRGNYKKIAWEHSHHNDNEKYIKSLVKSCENLDKLVLVSNGLADFYKTYLGDKVIFIPNCIDEVNNEISKLDNKNLITVGRLSKEKGYDDLLRLFKKLSTKYPDWKLNIVGDGLERNTLLDIAKELKLGEKVVFHGFQSKDYINDLLKESSMYIMTSHTECFPIVLLEAMSYGLPCLAYTSAQGANEIIEDGVTGYLIKDRNEDEMSKKISDLILDEKLRKKFGKAAVLNSKNYIPSVISEKWSKLIEEKR